MAASASVSLAVNFILVISSSSPLATAGSVKLVLKVPVLAKEQTPLTSLVVAESLDVVELGSQGRLLLGQDIEVVVEVANNAEKVGVLARDLILVGGKVSKSQVGIVNL